MKNFKYTPAKKGEPSKAFTKSKYSITNARAQKVKNFTGDKLGKIRNSNNPVKRIIYILKNTSQNEFGRSILKKLNNTISARQLKLTDINLSLSDSAETLTFPFFCRNGN